MSGTQAQAQTQPRAPWDEAFTQITSITGQTWVQKEDVAAAIALPAMHMLFKNAKVNSSNSLSKQEFPLPDVGLGFANQVIARNLVERLLPNCPPKAIHAAISLVAGGLLSMEEAFGLHNGSKQYCNFAEGAVASSLTSLLAALTCQAEQQKK